MINKKTTLPDKSILKKSESSFEYVDSYNCDFFDKDNKIGFPEISKAFSRSKSKWISALMALRDGIVKPFGLKTSAKVTEKQVRNFEFVKGGQLGIFKVFDKVENEVILGENDRHLDFRISILLDNPTKDKKNLSISSVVTFNNRFGRLYFMVIKPFHHIIVPKMLKGILNKIEEKNTMNR